MKVSLLSLIPFLLIILFSSCRGREFEIDFKLQDDVEENYYTLYYAKSKKGGVTVQGVAPVISGKCQFKGQTIVPTVLYLYNHTYTLPTVIYIEKGDKIKVEGETANPYEWSIGGNEINKELSEWRNGNSKILTEASPVDVNKAVEQYVKNNPENPVATILMLTLFNRGYDEELYAETWKILRGEALNQDWIELISRSDQPGKRIDSKPAHLRSVILRSYTKGLDTLHTDRVKGSLLIFRNTMSGQGRDISDSLKVLSKEFPDSSKRLIADIYVDSDSIGWRNQLRRDSLKGVARLLMPEGPTDPLLMTLGVRHPIFFMVVDTAGVQVYRGRDIDSAMNRFRTLIKE